MTYTHINNRLLSLFLFIFVSLLSVYQAQAMVLTYTFEGNVAVLDGQAPSPFNIGQTLSGSISYDTSTPASSMGPMNAAYNDAITLLNVALGSYSLSGSGGTINIVNNNDLLGDNISLQVPVTGASLNGIHPVTFSAGLQDFTGLAIDGTNLGPLPVFSAFSPSTFFLTFALEESGPAIPQTLMVSGPITSVTPVPIPAAAVLFASGLMYLWQVIRPLTVH